MFWVDPWAFGRSMWKNALALHETAVASEAVIRHRRGTIDDAMRNPMGADLVELSRMVPEKVAAFSQAGGSLMQDWLAMQSDCFAQWQEMTAMAMTGRVPSADRVARVGRRATRIAAGLNAAGGRALAPIHAAATANHKRLGKSAAKPRKSRAKPKSRGGQS